MEGLRNISQQNMTRVQPLMNNNRQNGGGNNQVSKTVNNSFID
jgi:hypothetical protein